ncbi:hypothetical protein GCM10009527_096940 [Actinomadura nitritigenes]|uniref:Uncharacterized protein n=1 Tax=Actinomadura nitritigenes TaxID=134602 RepID=A0ABS3QTR4_9ACTN|nr:hypothetical protein [Actinomadura nitritigenes]MBO2437147.1 hypothetical protein [Actinomadura nitritigenes]
MNRSARNLLGLSAAAPLAAALALSASPANAVQGPVADLVYGTVGQVGPALPPVAPPAPASDTASRTVESATGTADGAVASATRPGRGAGLGKGLPVSRTASVPGAAARACRTDPMKTVDGTRVTRLLPHQTMALTPGRDGAPISAPRSGSCLPATDRAASGPGAASGLPAPVGEAAKVPGRVVGRVTSVPKRVVRSKVGKALPNGRSAAPGASGGGPLGDAVALGLPSDAASLRSAAPISMVVPDEAGLRRAEPAPQSLTGETGDTVNTMQSQVGSVVNVLKTRERPSGTRRAGDGGLTADGLVDGLYGPPVYLPRLPALR